MGPRHPPNGRGVALTPEDVMPRRKFTDLAADAAETHGRHMRQVGEMVRERTRKQRRRKSATVVDNTAKGPGVALQPTVLGESGSAIQLLPKLEPAQEEAMLALYKEEGIDGVMLGFGFDESVATRLVGRAARRVKMPVEDIYEAEGLNDVKLARTHHKLLDDKVSDQVREKALTTAHKLKGRLSDKPDKSPGEAAADAVVRITEVLAGLRAMPARIVDDDEVPALPAAEDAT